MRGRAREGVCWKRLAAYRVEETERRKIDHAIGIHAGDPRYRTRHHQIGQQFVVIGSGMLGGVDLHVESLITKNGYQLARIVLTSISLHAVLKQ
jgi:hypothetical protein